MFKNLFRKKIPVVKVKTETRVVDVEVRKFKVAPYVAPSHKEIIEGLEFQDNYEAAFLIENLKKENANLKRKLTVMRKKI